MIKRQTLLEQLDSNIDMHYSYYAVLTFDTELNMNVSNEPGKWMCTGQMMFPNSMSAFSFFTSLHNTESQIIVADSYPELLREIETMKNNYSNQTWVEQNVYNRLD